MSFVRVRGHLRPIAMATQFLSRIYPPITRTVVTATAPSRNTLSHGNINNSRSIHRLTPQPLRICLQPAPFLQPRQSTRCGRQAISTTKNNASNTSTLLVTDTSIIERVPASTPITPVTPNTLKPSASPAKQARDIWTLESNSVLVELAETGMSWSRISRVTGRARTTCLQHYKKYLAPFNAMAPQGSRAGAEAGAGSFSDLTLIKKRVQENKPWYQIAAEMGQSSEVLRIRFNVLEPWLRQGMGHRSSAVRSEALTGFAKKVDGIFEVMVKDEPGLTLETVQGWYDRILLYSHRTRYNVIRQREREALLSTPVWTSEMDAKLLRMESEGRSWAAIEDELGRPYEDCLRRLHYAQKMKRRLHGLDGVTPHSSIARLHQHYDLLARQIWTPEIDEVIVRMWEGESESTWAMIGAMVGVDPGLCCSRYHSVLRPLVESVWSKRKTKQLHHLIGLGESWDMISSTLGLSRAACKMRWKQTRNDSITGLGRSLATSQRVAREVESQLYKHGRIERFYTCQDWDELLGMTSRTLSIQDWKRRQLDWLNQHPAWSERAENVLIQLVLRKGLGAWDEIAAAVNTDARMNLSKAMAARIVTAAECRMHWKNLDMPVRRSYDSREWTASTRCSFWSAFSWCRMQEQQNKEMIRGQPGYQQFWNKVAHEMGMPGGGEQCLVFFEDSVRRLVALDDKTIMDHTNQQIQTLREKATQQGLTLRPKHWSVVFQDIVRQNKSRLGEVEWRKVAAQMGDHQWSTHACTLDRDTNTSAFVNSIEWHWRHIHKDAGPPWSHSELKLLEQGIRECGFDWKEIWSKYLPRRTWSMMRTRWYRLSDCATRITVDEYMTLLQAVDEQHQPSAANIDWSKVVARMPEGWSMKPCRRAYESSYRHLLEQKRFTPEEDQWLLQNMKPQRNGSRDWKAAVDRFPESGFSAWQYRLRWCQLTDTLVS